MKKLFFWCLLIVFVSAACTIKKNATTGQIVAQSGRQLKYALTQTDPLLGTGEKKLVAPRTTGKDGELHMVPTRDWTSGFFAGELWYMYEMTGDKYWEKEARRYTELLEQEKLNGKTHDMGFKMFCSYGNGYRLTKDEQYKEILLQSARTLSTRFSEKTGCIRSWDHNSHRWKYPVIIDNMMNLELLFWATKETGDSTFYNIAVSHALKTMENHFRDDFSCFHVVDYHPETGAVVAKNTHQGYSDNSAWSRGISWALYGYTMVYRETGDKRFLAQAENVACYIINHPRKPEDAIPYWDYDAPEIPDAPRDASAAAVMASGFYELAGYSANISQYLSMANRIMKSLSSDAYSASVTSNNGFLLKHSTGSKPYESEVDAPLVYADYYFLEALKRKQEIND